MANDYIIAPGLEFEPGDVFSDIAFPNLRHPFKRYRPDPKPPEPKKKQLFVSVEGADKPGDIIHSTFDRKLVMVVSHGCELDKVLKLRGNPARKHWSCAPVESFHANVEGQTALADRQERTRNGLQPNRFYIPQNKYLGELEHYVDLRRITPLPAQYFIEAKNKKACSLSEDGKYDLWAQMGINQSGLLFYVQTIPCPECGTEIDPKQYMIESGNDPEDDADPD